MILKQAPKPLLTASYMSISMFITTFFVVCFVSQACAETTWIKWQHSINHETKTTTRTDVWYLQEAFPRYEQCMSASRGSANSLCTGDLSTLFPTCIVVDTTVQMGQTPNRVSSVIEFYCYPDTIDPRKK